MSGRAGSGHPLPASDEARHDKIPEGLEEEKGSGEEGAAAVQPTQPAANPDGEPYLSDGEAGSGKGDRDLEFERDQQAHQDRGQSDVEDGGASAE